MSEDERKSTILKSIEKAVPWSIIKKKKPEDNLRHPQKYP